MILLRDLFVVLGMLILTFGSVSLGLAERELVWRSCTAAEAMTTTWRVQINDKEFAAAAFAAASVTLISV